ncbi:GntR family transcriptional regulator [Bosea sp. BH3]|nr:GntR family transcriptional regulator [Bosea sp. BH3]
MRLPSKISDRILEAALARKLAPGSRLGESQLAALFACSRTLVREALIRLAERGVVTVSARRGWYLAKPSRDQAREAFEARLVVETGLLRHAARPNMRQIMRLRGHIERQRKALLGDDAGLRSFLLGDFHACLAEVLGNHLLAVTVRDLTVRTTLAATHHQSRDEAAHSFAEHEAIVAALEAGDIAQAERCMAVHLGTWEAKLRIPADADPLQQLRDALEPVVPSAQPLHTSSAGEEGRKPTSPP